MRRFYVETRMRPRPWFSHHGYMDTRKGNDMKKRIRSGIGRPSQVTPFSRSGMESNIGPKWITGLRRPTTRILTGLLVVPTALVGLSAFGVDAAHASTTKTYVTLAEPSLDVRSFPSTSSKIVGSLAYHTTVTVLCQTYGTTIHGSDIWDAIAGNYSGEGTGFVSDYYVSTPNFGHYSSNIPQCPRSGGVIITPAN
jgi:hypothetical protein